MISDGLYTKIWEDEKEKFNDVLFEQPNTTLYNQNLFLRPLSMGFQVFVKDGDLFRRKSFFKIF